MQIKINKMNIDDLNKISPVLLKEFDDFWNYNIFKSELENENSKYVVAKNNDEIVGFACIWISIDEAHVTNIVTKKDLRKNGIGSTLLEELINLSKNLNLVSITLEVNENNLDAIKLYEKFGFEKLGIRKKYYNNTDNALIMTKKLN